MNLTENYRRIMRAVPMVEQLAQLAEEASELAQAALKLRRAMAGVNPTPMDVDKCWTALSEEIADVYTCVDVVVMSGDVDYITRDVERVMERKAERWAERLDKHRCNGDACDIDACDLAEPPRMG